MHRVLRRWAVDGPGAMASALCAVHCGAAPFLVGVPLVGLELVLHPACEWGLLLFSTLTALAALVGRTRGRSAGSWPAALFAVGLALVWAGHLAAGEGLESALVVAGAVVLMTAHCANACGSRCAVGGS